MKHQCQLSNCVIDAETCFLQKNSGLRIIREPPQVSKLTKTLSKRGRQELFLMLSTMSSLPNQILCLPVHITWEQMKKDARDFVPPSVICSTKCPTIIQDWERVPPSCSTGPPSSQADQAGGLLLHPAWN